MNSFLFPLKIIYINYNYPHIYWLSNDLIHIELESSSKTYDVREGSFSLIKTFFDKNWRTFLKCNRYDYRE